MATTINRDGSKAEHAPPPYAEQDKLGPLGGKRSVLDDEAELRRVLVGEFQAAADAAREAAASVGVNATTAVHDYRKALRRARAVLALLAAELPKGERRAVQRALREARRALGTARDHAVAPDTISLLTLDEAERATVTAIVSAAGDAIPPVADIKHLLNEGAARAAAQVEALEAALPQRVAWESVERGLRRVYSDARRARKAGRKSKRAFHAWRRRSKELTYQLQVLSGLAGMHVSELSREIEGITDTQGPAVDLIMLRDFVRTHAAGVAPEALDELLAAIASHIDDLMRDSRRAGRDGFRRKPRRFARRVTKAMRRDLTPPVSDDVAAD